MSRTKVFGLIGVILVLLIAPFIIAGDSEFSGADSIALDIVMELEPEYEPIANHIFEPPSGEIESMLFTMQGVLGALIIGYFIGYKKGIYKHNES